MILLIESIYGQSQVEFIIGAYDEKILIDTNTYAHTAAQIVQFTNEYKDCNINFIAGWSQYVIQNANPSDTYNFNNYRNIIDGFYKPNLYTPIFCFSNKKFTFASQNISLVSTGNALDSIISKYNSRMSTYSTWYNLGDEPLTNSAINHVLLMNRKIKKASINNKTYVSLVGIGSAYFDSTKILNPYFPPYINSITYRSCNKYKNYLKRFKKQINDSSQIDMIAFDYYPHSWPTNGNYDVNNYEFYATLISMQEVFGREFISFMCSTPYIDIILPNENQLLHSVFSSIAYGAKGIIYWIQLPEGNPAYYNIIKKTNRYLKDILGPVAANYSKCITLHKTYNSSVYDDPNKTIYQYNQSNSDCIINDVSHENVLVTQFETNDDVNLFKGYLENDNKYILLTNKSTTSTITNLTVNLKGSLTDRLYLAPRINNYQPNSKNYSKISTTLSTFPWSNSTSFEINEILPGEGILVKLVPIVTPCPADYDGDGNIDLAVKSSTGQWRINYGVNGYPLGWDIAYNGWQGVNAIPVPADYDGDGKADLSIKTNDYGGWYFDFSWNGFNNNEEEVHWGYGGINNIPVPADYDGDGKVDIGIKNNTNGTWSINLMKNTFNTGYDSVFYGYGDANSIPAPADFDGDGKADLSCKTNNTYYLPNGSFSHKGEWGINFAKNGFSDGYQSISKWVGGPEAIPSPADYDGDGKFDLAVKSDYDGKWYVNIAKDSFLDSWDTIASINSIPINFSGIDYRPFPNKYYGTSVKYCTFSKENIWKIYGSNAIWYQGKALATFPIDSSIAKPKFSEMDISIYPNPSNGLFNIEFSSFIENKSYFINIYNIYGTKINSQEFFNKRETIDMSSFKSGNYIFEVISEKEVIRKKISLVH